MDSVSKVKQRLSIVEVVGSYIDLKKSGKNYKAVCPFHVEDTPSFMVSPDLGIYKCFGCGAGGDIFSFVQEIDGIGFYEALKKLAQRAGVELEDAPEDRNSKIKGRIYSLNETTAKFYSHILLNHRSGKKGLDYLLEKRGLSMEVVETFQLGYAPHAWDTLGAYFRRQKVSEEILVKADLVKRRTSSGYYDKFRGRVMFPLVETTKKIAGFMGRTIFDEDPKYLNTGVTPVFNKSDFVYGLGINRVQIKKEGAVLVEGPMDVISAYQHDIRNVVAPLGTSLTTNHLKILSRYTDDITLCFDSDTAGLEAIKRAVFMAEKLGLNVRVAMIPESYRDLDELLKEDPLSAKDLLKSAVSVYDFFIAYVLKKYDSKSGIGKKRIMEELKTLFSAASSEVTLDHYVKKIADKIDLKESVAFSVLTSQVDPKELTHVFGPERSSPGDAVQDHLPAKNLDTYFYILAFKLKRIEDLLPFLGLLEASYFVNEDAAKLYGGLQSYFGQKTSGALDIKAFIDTIDGRLASFVTDLYMWDSDRELDDDAVLAELEQVSNRLEKRYVKTQIDLLGKELALAEMQGDSSRVKEITTQINEYSKKLI